MNNKKVVFSGLPSTGKSTLLKRLKELPEFQDYIVPPSIGRTLNSMNIGINEKGTLETQAGAFSFHLLYIEEDKGMLHERSMVDAYVLGSASKAITPEQQEVFYEFVKFNLKTRPIYDKIIYTPPIAVYEDDGIRTKDQEYLAEAEILFKKVYKELDLDSNMFHIVKAYGVQERFEEVLDFIRK